MQFVLVALLALWAYMLVSEDSNTKETADIEPSDGAVLSTPLTTVLKWPAVPGAHKYGVSLRMVGGRSLYEELDAQSTVLRVPLCPAADYEWTVTALDSNGNKLRQTPRAVFCTPKPNAQEITDYAALFSGVRPGAHWGIMSPLPEDPSQELSPWFSKKSYDSAVPPKFSQIRDLLPKPIWDSHPEAIDMYWYTWETLFNSSLFVPDQKNSIAVSNMLGHRDWGPFGISTEWDMAFMMYFTRYAHTAYPFITSLDNCYARQHENGFICREADAGNREIYKVYPVSLPLLSSAEINYYMISGDIDRLRQSFLPLVKEFEWFLLHQRRSNGLFWNVGIAEGTDDSPRNTLAHYYLSTTCCMASSATQLGCMARLLGYQDLAKWFQREAKHLKSLINAKFWDSKHNIYNDLGANGKPITHTYQAGTCKHAFIFWPMICGVTTPSRAASLASQLVDPGAFNRPSGITSLSADSTEYSPNVTGVSWRGGIWPSIQYMVIRGLQAVGNDGLAAYVAENYYKSFLKAFIASGEIKENLSPEAPVMLGRSKAVGWGGLAPVALLIEDIFGIRADAPANLIRWRVRRLERHGIDGLRYGNNVVTLICESRSNQNDPCRMTVECTQDFTLLVELPFGCIGKEIKAGRTALTVPDTD